MGTIQNCAAHCIVGRCRRTESALKMDNDATLLEISFASFQRKAVFVSYETADMYFSKV